MAIRAIQPIPLVIEGIGEVTVKSASMNDIVAIEDAEEHALDWLVPSLLVRKDGKALERDDFDELTLAQLEALHEGIVQANAPFFFHRSESIRDEDGHRTVDIRYEGKKILQASGESFGAYFKRAASEYTAEMAKAVLAPFKSLTRELNLTRHLTGQSKSALNAALTAMGVPGLSSRPKIVPQYRTPSIPIPTNPIHETNRVLKAMEAHAADTAQSMSATQTLTLSISDSLSAGLQDSRGDTKRAMWIAITALLATVAIGIVQIILSIQSNAAASQSEQRVAIAIEDIARQQTARDTAISAQLLAAAESLRRGAPAHGARRQRVLQIADEMEASATALRAPPTQD